MHLSAFCLQSLKSCSVQLKSVDRLGRWILHLFKKCWVALVVSLWSLSTCFMHSSTHLAASVSSHIINKHQCEPVPLTVIHHVCGLLWTMSWSFPILFSSDYLVYLGFLCPNNLIPELFSGLPVFAISFCRSSVHYKPEGSLFFLVWWHKMSSRPNELMNIP